MEEFEIRGISVGTIFKIVSLGLLFSLLPLTILAGCTAAMGLNTLAWNNQPLTGWTALFASPFIGIFLVAVFTATIGTAIAFGMWVYSLFGPFLISYKPFVESLDADQQPGQPSTPAR